MRCGNYARHRWNGAVLLTDTWRLAWRFARTSSRQFRWRLLVSSVLTCFATMVLMAAMSTIASLAHIDEVAEARSWSFAQGRGETAALVLGDVRELFGEQIEVEQIAPSEKAAVSFPGLAELPEPGQYAVSPALATLLAEHSAGGLFPGNQVIGEAGVASGGELFAVQVVPTRQLAGPDEVPITGYGAGPPRAPSTLPDVPLYPPVAGVLLLVVVPAITVLVAGAKLASAVREHRMSVLARLGARHTARRVAAMETLILGVPGLAVALAAWWIVWRGRADVPGVDVQVLTSAWQLSWFHGVALALVLLVLAFSAMAMIQTRRSEGRLVDPEALSPARSLLLSVGVVIIVALPWLSASVAADAFFIALVLCSLGVVIALPLWFRAVGGWLRGRGGHFRSFLVGARLHRFPRTSSRGWAALAMATAVFTPVAVWLNINALGDTDLQQTPPRAVQAFEIASADAEGVTASLADPSMPGIVGTYTRRNGRTRLVLPGTCQAAARTLHLDGCEAVRQMWHEVGPHGVSLRFSETGPSAQGRRAVVMAHRRAEPVGMLETVVSEHTGARITELTPPQMRPSPVVTWIVAGVAAAGLLVLLAIAVLVTDRSMTARKETMLRRIGLTLLVRRTVDAFAFAASYGIASAGGMLVGLLLALVMARSDLALLVPWVGLTSMAVALALLGGVGTTMVAIGSHRAQGTSLDTLTPGDGAASNTVAGSESRPPYSQSPG